MRIVVQGHVASLFSCTDEEPQLFRNPLLERRLNWASMAGSVTVHAVVLGFVWLFGSVSWFQNYTVDWAANYRVEPIRLQMPEPIYYTAGRGEAKDPVRQQRQPKKNRVAASPPGELARLRNAGRRWPVPPQLELPKASRVAEDAPVVLQPDLPVRPSPLAKLVPAMVFWARHMPQPARLRREIVIPGRTEVAITPPVLDATPVLSMPNREHAAADINMALALAIIPTPVLPVPDSATAPVRIRDARGEARAASFDPLQGKPVNVIAMAHDRPRAGTIVEIPAGLQNIPSDLATGGGPFGIAMSTRYDSGPQRGGTQTAQAGSGGTGSAASQSNSPSQRNETTANASAPVGTRAHESAAAGTGVAAAANSGQTASPSGADSRAPAAVTRIVHDGDAHSYDVVIIQSASRDDQPKTTGMLTGSPVYTVYLSVGDAKEWLLEYCIPARPDAQANTYRIDVGGPEELTPPYPAVTVVPNSILGQPRLTRVVLHGFITTAGRLRDVTMPDSDHSVLRQLLSVLVKWEFRPAITNRKPVELEFLLIIPPQS